MLLNRLSKLMKRFVNDRVSKRLSELHIDLISLRVAMPKEIPIENDQTWYIPHHGVQHPMKLGKIRVVFDRSAEFQSESLN